MATPGFGQNMTVRMIECTRFILESISAGELGASRYRKGRPPAEVIPCPSEHEGPNILSSPRW